jgi:hypothetical protein
MNGKGVPVAMDRRSSLLSRFDTTAMRYSCLPKKLAMILPDIGQSHRLVLITGEEPIIGFRAKVDMLTIRYEACVQFDRQGYLPVPAEFGVSEGYYPILHIYVFHL